MRVMPRPRGTPIITLHDESLTHALKEVDAAAMAVAETPAQVVRLLAYAVNGELAPSALRSA